MLQKCKQVDGNERNHCQSAVNGKINKALKVAPQWSDTTMLAWNSELIKGTSLHYITSRSASASSTSMYTHEKYWKIPFFFLFNIKSFEK
uniref:SCP domain-containing protein n=1 Tax=Wuchereria bancrofti TaxID=6293 RepID=A0AAF5Q1U5_WUCBA